MRVPFSAMWMEPLVYISTLSELELDSACRSADLAGQPSTQEEEARWTQVLGHHWPLCAFFKGGGASQEEGEAGDFQLSVCVIPTFHHTSSVGSELESPESYLPSEG